jgi:hypothetical protein
MLHVISVICYLIRICVCVSYYYEVVVGLRIQDVLSTGIDHTNIKSKDFSSDNKTTNFTLSGLLT